MKLYNTLTKKVEEFKPINPPNVDMYTCGPTVYDYQHIGNFRTMVLSDLLYRSLKYLGYKPKLVRNITDIDDKTIKGASKKGVSLHQFTKKFTDIFFSDLKKLNVEDVDIDTTATEYIDKMVDYIDELVKKGYAYVENDGSVYFEIAKFKNYGKLSGVKISDLKTGTRVLSDEYTKDNVQDFALWKSVKEGVGYDSPWGKGRPGWHIECSVMSQDKLGDTFDIHLGGVDLLFPHHENEIAQSEAKTGKKFVNYFVHGEFLLVDGGKMSKSLGNLYTVEDVEKKGYDPLALRYLYLTAHYRDPLNFTWESLKAAQKGLDRLRGKVSSYDEAQIGCTEYEQRFEDALNNDLNIPQALAIAWEMVKSDYPSSAKHASLLKFDEVLGLGLSFKQKKVKLSMEVKKLAEQREGLRGEGKFEEADKVRKKIEGLGYKLEDTDNGPEIT